MPVSGVKALVPTALAAALLLQEFPSAALETDGTLFTVLIFGVAYPDAVSRIREWMTRSQIGPVLVTDGETAEELLDEIKPGTARLQSLGIALSNRHMRP
jgi:hypothetical protein